MHAAHEETEFVLAGCLCSGTMEDVLRVAGRGCCTALNSKRRREGVCVCMNNKNSIGRKKTIEQTKKIGKRAIGMNNYGGKLARDKHVQEGDQTTQEQRLNINPRAVMYRLRRNRQFLSHLGFRQDDLPNSQTPPFQSLTESHCGSLVLSLFWRGNDDPAQLF